MGNATQRSQRRGMLWYGVLCALLMLGGCASQAVAPRGAPTVLTHSATPPPVAGGAVPELTLTKSDIFLIRLDGSAPRNLTPNALKERDAAWSPDGQQLAFTVDHGDIREVYVMNADGSHYQKIAAGMQPSWSPDGEQGVFIADILRSPALYLWTTSDSITTTLIQSERRILEATWSPDSEYLLFTTIAAGHIFIHLIKPDGTDEHRLVRGEKPTWSPDGQWVVFQGDQAKICIINRNGSGLTRLTDDLFWSDDPAWSPDGQHLAFVSAPQGGVANQLWMMRADGTRPRPLITEEGVYSSPTWSPDGRYLAYVRKHIVQNRWTVYALDLTNPEAEPQEIGLGSQPVWRPQP